MGKIRIAILASGSGSNAEAIMQNALSSRTYEVVCVLSDKKEAGVLERAKKFAVPAVCVPRRKNKNHEEAMLMNLHEYKPDFIVLAGFMRLLSPYFLNHYPQKIVNIHPSLLPLFPGPDGYGDAFRAGVKESGCTVHYVDEGMDTGEIIAQKSFTIIPGESFEEFNARGLSIENKFYPEVLEHIFRKKV